MFSFIVAIIVNALSATCAHYMKYAEVKIMIHVSIAPYDSNDLKIMISCDHS